MTLPAIENKFLKAGAFFLLFGAIAAFAYTGKYIFLLAPFVLCFVLLAGMNWKLAYWILLFTIPFSMEIELASGSLATTVPDEPIMWLFVIIFSLLWAKSPEILPKWWWRNPLVFIIVLQFIWTLIAVGFSQELFLSLKFTLAKIWMLISFFVFPIWVFKEKKDFKKAFILILIPLLATMVVIMVRHAAIGFSFILIRKAIGIIYYNHVDYSTVMSMFLPLLFVAYSLSKGKWVLRNILIFLILFFLVAIYLTYARAAMVAIFFSLAIYLGIRLKFAKLIMPAFYGFMALMLVLAIDNNTYLDYRPSYNNTYMHKTFTEHMIATIRGTDMSSMERVYRWIAGVRMSTDKPVTGVGPNAFWYYYKPYAVTSFKTYVSRNPEQSTAHNYFLFMLVEQGWPAMILYALLILVVFAQAQNIYHRFKDRFYKKCTIGIAMLIAAGFINNFFSDLIENNKVGALFYLGIALLVILDKKSREEQEQLQLAAGNQPMP